MRRMKTMKINSSLARSLARLRNREPDGESEGAVAEVLSRFSLPTKQVAAPPAYGKPVAQCGVRGMLMLPYLRGQYVECINRAARE